MVALLQRCVFRAFLQHLDAGSARTPLLGASAALVRAHRSAWQQRSSSGEYYFAFDLICTFLVFALQKKQQLRNNAELKDYIGLWVVNNNNKKNLEKSFKASLDFALVFPPTARGHELELGYKLIR